MRGTWNRCVGAVVGLLIAATLFTIPAFAFVPPDGSQPLRQKELFHPDLHYINVFVPIAGLEVDLSRRLGADLAGLGVDPGNAYLDRRTGRWGTLILTRPLIPGTGVGNDLRWADLGLTAPGDAASLERAAWQAFRAWLEDNATTLGIAPTELGEPSVTAIRDRLIQIHAPRVVDGVPVRHTFVTAAVNSGNLVLTGQRNWGEIAIATTPTLGAGEAEAVVRRHLDGFPVTGQHEKARLEIVPVSAEEDETAFAVGAGLQHRLVWVLHPVVDGDAGSWEAMVDAHSGELLSFQDLNQHLSRRIEGGVYPVSNDGVGDDGTEQPDYPMPFADILLDGSPVGFSTTGGNLPPGTAAGTVSTTLSGQFVRMADVCGAIDESAAAGDIDLLEGPGTNCVVPPGHSPGDTHASRTGFYELNRLKEQARGYLPGDPWLAEQLTANMNINLVCNAFWSNTNFTVNFYREGTSPGGTFCANTGEIAAIFDHEWGHGMDRRSGVMAISRPGEGIADIYAQNRLNTSCIGRNFRPGLQCPGYGDPCLECTGVREVDWMKRQSMTPKTVAWIDANCPSGPNTPCGGATHCEGSVVSESAWDLVHRDLMGFEGSLFNFDLNTALELGTRLAYFGSGGVTDWYQCVTDGTGGCNADSGYLGWLAADDDNGDLTDGTPHMTALFAAFNRHQIACNAPVVQNSGCAGTPTAPINLQATAFDEGMELTWDPVAGATEYQIFRTEGVNGCDFGKALVGTTTGTEFTEVGLRNGREVLYSVLAVGASDACTSPMSSCLGVIPVSGPSGTLNGTVTNSVTSAPIQGVTLQAVGPVTLGGVTLADGTYTIPVPVGTYDLTASMDGFFPQTEEDVEVTEGGTFTNDFALVPLPQTVDVSPASFTFEVFEAQSDSDTLNVGNVGNVDLTWNIGETATDCATQTDVGWLAANPASGVTPPFSSLEVEVTVDSVGLPAGVHEASFCVNSDDPATPVVAVPVTLTVVAAPAIQVTPEEIVVTVEAGMTHIETLTVGNLGSINLDWTIVQETLGRGLSAPLGGYRPVTDGAPRSGLVLMPADGAADAALDPELVAAAEAGIELSEPVAPDQRPRARGTSPNDVLQDGALIVPNTTLNFIVALDPETGDVLDPALVDITPSGTGARREVLLHPDGERLLLSAQTGDVVHAFSVADGSYLGVFAPAGGVDTSIMNNIRGMDFHPVTGNLLVTSSDAPAADRVVEFDLEGNFVRVFIDSAPQNGLSPWDLLIRENDILLTDSGGGTRRYDYDGNFLGDFETITNFPEQIAFAANGNILIVSLSGGWYEFDPVGTLIANFESTITSLAGVYELPNLNFVMTGNVTGPGQGIHEVDRTDTLVRSILDGTSYQINFVQTLDCTLPSWLTVSPTSGTTAPDSSTDVTATIDTAQLGLGEHEASICFESNDPIQPLLVVPVTLTVTGNVPQADISPTSFDVQLPLDGNTTETLNIGSVGQLDLVWSIEEADAAAGCASPSDVSWLTATPASGTTPPGNTAAVSVAIDALDLNPGLYEAILCVHTNDGDQLLVPVPVTLTVLGAVADITPASFTFDLFQGGSETATLNVGSTGTEDLIWSIAEAETDCATTGDVTWLAADPLSGTTPTGSSTEVAVTADTAGLAPGAYTGNLCVATNDAGAPTVTVPVTLTVSAAPVVDVVPESLSVTLPTNSTGSEPVEIHNLGQGVLDWTIPTDPALGTTSEPLVGFTFKTAAATSPDPQSWTRISTDGGTVANAPDDTGAPSDVTFTWGEMSGSMSFLGTATLAPDAVPQYDYDLQGMNGYGFGSGARFFIELSGLDPNTPYEYWFVAYRATAAIANVVDVSDGDVVNAFQFNQTIAASPANNGRFIVNDQISSNTQHWNDLSFVTTSSSTGTIRFEWQGNGQTTVIGAFAVRPLFTCALPSWLSVAPTSGSINPGDPPDTVTATIDTTGLALGEHSAAFCVDSNDPFLPTVAVPVNLTVTLPGDKATIEGTVQSLGYCGADAAPLEGATVEIVGAQSTTTLTTNADGFYQAFLNVVESPIDINVTAAGHLPQSVNDIPFVGGDTVVQSFDLTLEAPCATASPGDFAFELAAGDTASDTLTIGNVNGGADLTWSLVEAGPTDLFDPRAHFPAEPRFVEHGSLTPGSWLADPDASAAAVSPALGKSLGGAVPAYTTTGFNVVGYVTLDATVPGTVTVVNPTQPTNIYAATFINNDFTQHIGLATAGTVPQGTLISIDTATGAVTTLGTLTGAPSDGTWTSMKWDHTTSTLYATNFLTGRDTQIYTIDPSTFAATLVGTVSGTGVNPDALVISMAISPTGQMYGIEINDDVLLAIDKTNAQAAVIGALGEDFAFAQDMDFDQTTGTLYWAGYRSGGNSRMFTVDTATAGLTLLGPVQGGSELLSFTVALPGAALDCANPEDIPWLSAAPTSGTATAGASSDVLVTVDTAGLAPGEYEAGLCVTTGDASNNQIVVPVDLTVLAAGDPVADITPASFSFEVTPGGTDGDTLNIANAGGGVLEWSITEDGPAALGGAVDFPADPGSLGPIADSTSCGTEGTPLNVTFPVSGLPSGALADVQVAVTMNHTWVGDVIAMLIAPDGAEFPVFARTGTTTATGNGDSSNLGNVYTFSDGATAPPSGGWWQEAAAGDTSYVMAAGTYRSTQAGGAGTPNPAPATEMTAAFAGVADPNGTWTMRFTDRCTGDTGSVTAATLTLTAGGGGGGLCDDVTEVPWLSVDPASGTTPAGESDAVAVSVDSAGLALGTHEAALCVATNDPAAPTVTVPVTLTVGAPVADITPTSFSFTVPEGGSDSGTLNMGNTGNANLIWSLAEAEAPALLGAFAENFDGYADGSQMHGQGGWKGWLNDPAAGALVSSAQSTSSPHSVEIVGASDLVHEFEGINSGQWTVTAWQFVPTDFTGTTMFILLNTYNDQNQGLNWSTQVELNATTDTVINAGPAGGSLPLVTGEWVELKVEIDFDTDTQTFFYDGQQLFTGSWTDGLSGDGALNLDTMDLFANNSSPVYYDDITIAPAGGGCASPNDVSWLSAIPTSGTTAPGGSSPVTVSVDATGLAAGEYNALLCATTNDPLAELIEIPVDLTVTSGGGPTIDVDPDSMSFTLPAGGTDADDLGISNIGAGTLSWTIDTAEPAGLAGLTVGMTKADVMAREERMARAATSPKTRLLPSERPAVPQPTTEYVRGGDIVGDGGFEAGSPNPVWDEASTNFGTPLCTVGGCGQGGGTGPHSGSWWAWFGGTQALETGSVSQSVTIPSAGSAELRFWLEIPVVDPAGGFLDVSLDGDVLFNVTEADGPFVGYQEVVIDVSAYADGGTYELRFDSTTQPGAGVTNFFVDDVSITVGGGGGEGCDNPTTIPWLSVTPDSGDTDAGQTDLASVMVDAGALTPGSYSALLCVNSNDPVTPRVEVPVDLTVTGDGGPVADISPESFSFEVAEGGSASDTLSMGNTGNQDLTWSLAEASPSAIALGRHVPIAVKSAGSALQTQRSIERGEAPAATASFAGGAGGGPLEVVPGPATLGDVQMSQTPDTNIVPANSIACPTGPNHWFRRFYFSEHPGVGNPATINSVDFAIQEGVATQTLTVNLYTIPSSTPVDTIPLASLTSIGTGSVSISPANDGTIVNVPVSGTVSDTAAMDLVVEATVAGGMFPGATDTSQTHPGFIMALACGLTAPGVINTIPGFEDTFLIMIVNAGGGGGGGGCDSPSNVPWLSASPTSGTTAPGGSEPVTVSVDATGLTPGDYSALLCATTNDPLAELVEIPVDLTVTEIGEAPVIDVDPDSMDSTLPPGQTETQDLTIANLGDATLDWQVTEDGGGLADAGSRRSVMDAATAKRLVEAAGRVAVVAGTDVLVAGAGDTPSWSDPGLVPGAPDRGVHNVFSSLGSLTFYNDRGDFQTANPGLTLEDFADTNVPPNNVGTCTPPLNASSNDACFSPGDIVPGISMGVTVGSGGGLGVVLTPPFLGVPCVSVGPNSFGDHADWDFDPPVKAFGFDLQSDTAGQVFTLTIFGPGGELGSTTVTAAGLGAPVFFGVDTQDAGGISRVEVNGPGDQGELFCAVEFGGAQGPLDCTLPGWVSVNPTSGSVAPAGSQPVDVTFDSTGLAPDTYTASLCLASNDPETPIEVVPLTLTVEAPAPVVNISPDSFAFEVPQGGSAMDVMNVGNQGTADLEWGITEDAQEGLTGVGSRTHDPALDEPLDLGDFQVISPANGGSPVVITVPGGVATQGLVVGFHFIGTASGMGDTGSWASDTCMIVEAPDGTTFGVGGFSGTNPNCNVNDWDFQGSGSQPDGTYESEHDDVFGGVEDEGTWTFTFINDWNSTSAATINWADVTVTLHKAPLPICDDVTEVPWLSADPTSGLTAPETVSPVDVMVEATGLAAGVYEAALCVATNDPLAPTVTVPVSLTVTDAPPIPLPTALVADPDEFISSNGNLVFEPGEVAHVAPSWQNTGGASVDLSGTAMNFTGPAGATYETVVDSATYGVVAGGATASCLDQGPEMCYALGVDDPVTRPAAHWDATFDEELSEGTTKTWTLHVGGSFTDVADTSIFYPWIETLFHSGVTGGCAVGQYCPASPNTRGQMAVFLLKALEGPGYAPPACVEGSEVFADVPFDNLFCSWIEELAGRGVTAGCGGGNYCPNASVQRDQMSVFLLKTLLGTGYVPPACTGVFGDVACPSLFANWIEDLVDRGITAGCGGGNYCPASPVSRDQMAVFLSRTFGLTLYGP